MYRRLAAALAALSLTIGTGHSGPAAPAAIATAQADQAEITFWNSVKDSKDPAELQAYLEAYPAGKFAPLAKIRLNRLATGKSGPPGESASGRDPSDLAAVIAKVKPSLVAVTARRTAPTDAKPQVPPGSPFDEFFKEFFKDQANKGRAADVSGSGFVYGADGLIVTVDELVAAADAVFVTLQDGTRLDATIAGRDPRTNVALLKVTPPRPLAPVDFGSSRGLKLGDRIVVLGLPAGVNVSATPGFVTRLNVNVNAGPYDDFIQTDVAAGRSMSGGIMATTDGAVAGVLMPKTVGPERLSLAVPAELVRPVVDQLDRFGETRRGWLGVRIQAVSQELAESLGLDSRSGALVVSVTADGPAAKAGITEGDVIRRFGGIDIEDMRTLPRAVAEVSPGEAADVGIVRNGEQMTLSVTLGLLPTSPDAPAAAAPNTGDGPGPLFGMTLLEAGGKLMVKSVDPGSEAAAKKISAGDVVTEVGGEAVGSVQQAEQLVRKAAEQGRKAVLFLVTDAKGQSRFIALPLKAASVGGAATQGTLPRAKPGGGDAGKDLKNLD